MIAIPTGVVFPKPDQPQNQANFGENSFNLAVGASLKSLTTANLPKSIYVRLFVNIVILFYKS